MKKRILFSLSMALMLAVWIACPGMAAQREHRQAAAAAPRGVMAMQNRGSAFDLMAPKRIFKTVSFPRKMAAPSRVAANDGPTLYGITNIGEMPSLVSFPAASFTEFTVVKQSQDLETSGGGVYVDGLFYNFSLNLLMGQVLGAVGHVWDTDEWTLERTLDDLWSSSCARDLAYDPVSGKIYGQFYKDDMQDLYWGWIDPSNGSVTTLGRLGVQVAALGCTAQGDMYAVIHNGKLIKIDKDKATYEVIGNTGLMPRYIQSGTIDQATGKFYWAAYLEDNTSGLYEVDLTTAKATLLSAFPDNAEITGLFILPPAAEADAPGKPQFGDITFDGGSLTGRVKVTLPKNTYGGDEISDFLDVYLDVTGPDGYSASYDDNDYSGVTLSFRVTVPKAGMYTFTTYCKNDAGQGPSKKKVLWIGSDKPLAPTDLTTSLDGNTVTISWKAPQTGQNEGYVDPSTLTYDVVRLPDQKAVATATSATSVTDELPEGSFASYQYSVTAINGDQRGEPVVSTPVNYGSAYQPPLEITIKDKDSRDLFTVIDANNDGTTFGAHYTGALIIDADQNDDWAVSPPVSLKAGTQYSVKFQAYINNSLFSPEAIEICAGLSADAASLNIPVADFPSLQCFREFKLMEGLFTPEEDGIYYFGLHDKTNPSSTYVELNYFSIAEGPSLAAPLAVTDLSAKAADRGELRAELSFKAPLKDYAGKDLTSISRIDILRGEKVIGSIKNPAPGSTQTFTDNEALQGDNTYTVKPYGPAEEEGETAEVTVYVGVDTPSSPTDIKLVQEGNNVVLTWKAPTTGANGGYIDPDKCVYAVYSSIHEGVIEENITGTRWGADVTSYLDDDQFPLYFGVYAINAAGGSVGVPSNTIILGKAYDLPFSETFPYGYLEHEMWITSDANGDCAWEPTRYDGADNSVGYTVFNGAAKSDQRLSTGKINLCGATEPVLEFWCLGNDKPGRLDIEATTDYFNFSVLKSIEFKGEGWQKIEIPLTQFSGSESVQIAFHGYGLGDTYYDVFTAAIDEVRIEQKYADNLRAHAITANKARVEIGEEPVKFSFTVVNRGKNDVKASDWTLSFVQDGKERVSLDGVDLAAGTATEISYDYVPTFDDPNLPKLRFEVLFDKDMYVADNASGEVTLQIDKPDWPSVTDLSGEIESETGKASLKWTAPDFSGTPEGEVTESFENYKSFDIEKAGDWTLRDVDGSFTYTITGFSWPNTYMPQAWIVWTPSEVTGLIDDEPLSEVWWPRTGDKCMACFAGDTGLNDDWLISPMLSGKEQEISFWARSTIDEYGQERFEVWYSDTDTEISSFKQLGDTYTAVPSDWTEFKYMLPAGAKYFAIRCVSPDRFCLLVDDVTFERAARALGVEFKGYNVYVDGALANDVPLKDAAVRLDNDNRHDYFVKVVYDKGESARSNVVTLGTAGVGTVTSDGSDGRLYDLRGYRVNNPQTGEVYIRKGEKFVRNR